MSESTLVYGSVVEEQIELTFTDLCRACRAEREQVIAWVGEGVLEPAGEMPDDWRFSGASLQRARTALRLSRDLELNAAGVALVLDLLDEIDALKARLLRVGAR
jgi:chaperone modulatory protein CbpM